MNYINKLICFFLGHKSRFKKDSRGHRFFKNGHECKRCNEDIDKDLSTKYFNSF